MNTNINIQNSSVIKKRSPYRIRMGFRLRLLLPSEMFSGRCYLIFGMSADFVSCKTKQKANVHNNAVINSGIDFNYTPSVLSVWYMLCSPIPLLYIDIIPECIL